jgi:two-component system, NtrC family, sensor histidine kinase HydH
VNPWLRARVRPFSGSLVRRYSVLLVIATLAPMVVVGFVYDRYMRSMLDQFTGERLEAQLAGTASRISAFLDARTYQLERLARYPIPPQSERGAGLGEELTSLVRLEADDADLYGIIVFANDGALREVVRGQAASGPPYWSEAAFAPEQLPRGKYGDAEIVGPFPPREGQSGWFLLQEPLRGEGHIALHVRLASLTDLLGAPSVAGVLEPVLQTPAGYFDVVGQPAAIHGQLMEGPEIAAGWRPCLLVDPQELLRPFQVARRGLFIGSLVAVGAIAFVLARMAGRLKRRVEVLADGAELIAGGDFDHRVPDFGDDEIGHVAVAFNRMASKLRRLVEREVRLERLAALGEFSTGVAHEVRNPLATLKTTVQALARVDRDPQRATLLRDMEGEIDRMSRTMGQILAFGRPRPPEPTRLRLRDTARRLESLLANEAIQRQVGFTVQGDLDLHVRVDEDHLLQLLLNLALNALQATPPGGLVTLRCWREADRVAIEIRDTGSGISPEALARVFVPFFTTKPGGTGLGLSICRQLAQLNGGTLDLESMPGQGTTARLLLEDGGDRDGEHPDRR